MNQSTTYWPELYSNAINDAITEQWLETLSPRIGTQCTFRGINYQKGDIVVLESCVELNLLKIWCILVTNEEKAFLIGQNGQGFLRDELQLYEVHEDVHITCEAIDVLQDFNPYQVYYNLGFPAIALKYLTS